MAKSSANISISKWASSPPNIGIARALWNDAITSRMEKEAIQVLKKAGLKEKNIIKKQVAGSFELPYMAQEIILNCKVDAVIVLGVVIKGETMHDEVINHAVAKSILDLSLQHRTPIAFGVLTTLNEKQAIDRSNGKHENKGKACAEAVLQLLQEK